MKVDKDWKAVLNTNGTFFDICYGYVRHNPEKGERVVPVVVISAADWEIEQSRVAALEADAARMDLLDSFQEAYGYEDTLEGYRWMVEGPFKSVRAAIDDAMKGGA